ncbi:M10 family metallopeptidase C-terminal domain-containing protein [Qipengyuania aurantiaca]|uniref:M10 family metallopeptidase C-terminal domain-containing protein n=1 Tax=Qipengyuania aurantiaca TaxID=2867233 RepID=A0ABX8ZSA0_9SPHN|nr:M10 family metallopeptidase C-terminal domain-containing protein [Qipengyuania aurantiaca]QZD90472.1 M10 family metallopeptidase C-terminal domain-containing protein [Qipengyuania aurantiaca]
MAQAKDYKPFDEGALNPVNGGGNGNGNGGGSNNAGGNGTDNGRAGENGNGATNGNAGSGTTGNDSSTSNGNGIGNGGSAGGNGNGNATVDAYAADTTTTGVLADGQTIATAIDSRTDVDWFAVELVAGSSYQFATTAGATGSIGDTVLALYDADGNLVAGNDDSNNGAFSTLLHTAEAGGTYYVAVLGYQGDRGSYEVSMNEIDLNDAFAAGVDTAGTIAAGETILTQLDYAGDSDWFAFDIALGQAISFSTAAGTGAAANDTVITIYDAAGNALLTNDDNGTDLYSFVDFAAEATGTYYVEVSGFDGVATGSYALTALLTHNAVEGSVDQISEYLSSRWFADMGEQAGGWALDASRTITVDLSGLDASMHEAARVSLAAWGDAAGITFIEQAGGALQFVTGTENDTTVTRSGGFIDGAIVTIDPATPGFASATRAYQVVMQEVGFALGLGHAGQYTNGQFVSYRAHDLVYLNDSNMLTVMSGFDNSTNVTLASRGYSSFDAITPMMADVAAIQAIYGAPTNTRTGDDTYGFNSTAGDLYDASLTTGAAYTIVDSAGVDTLDYSQHTQNQLITLIEGRLMNVGGLIGNVSIAQGTVIENAIGGMGDDYVRGNNIANTLHGGLGNDTVRGLSGDDRVDGGEGDDWLFGNNGNDTLSAAAGLNRMFGAAGDDVLIGGSGFDKLFGGAGNDALFGGSGRDLLMSWDGNNYMDGGNGSDVIVGGNGNDTLIGGADDHGWDKLRGGAGDDILISGMGNDNLQGGAGDDWMDAGGANDFLNGKAGIDTMFGGSGNDVLFGGDGNDILDGGRGNDRLKGGAGDDLLTGGAGADSFIMDKEVGVDTITDFISGVDLIELWRPAFTEVRFGTLWKSAFALGTEAADAGDRIIYDEATGNIWYDADGTGVVEKVLFAKVAVGTHLEHTDFYARGASPSTSTVGMEQLKLPADDISTTDIPIG